MLTKEHIPWTALRILVVEDDEYTREAILVALRREGFKCTTAESASKASLIISKVRPDLVVLDLGLPDEDGLDFLKSLRVSDDLPVVVCTGRSDEHERVKGLDVGADDYIAKPFSPNELVLRVKNILKRVVPNRLGNVVVVGELTIDPKARSASIGREVISLTVCEFDLLLFLASNPGIVYTRDELLRTVWRTSPETAKHATVTEHVRRLRKKLNDTSADPRYIKAVRGIGYRVDL